MALVAGGAVDRARGMAVGEVAGLGGRGGRSDHRKGAGKRQFLHLEQNPTPPDQAFFARAAAWRAARRPNTMQPPSWLPETSAAYQMPPAAASAT